MELTLTELRIPGAGSRPSVPAFSPLVEPEHNLLLDLPVPITSNPGVYLIEQGQSPAFVGLLRSGIVKLTYMSDEGDEMILGLRSEGWWLNANLALLNVPSLCTVQTVTKCSISKVDPADFSNRLSTNSGELYQLLLSQCRELLTMQQHVIMRGRKGSERLSYLLGESGQSIWKTVDPMPLMRQSDIAELLSMTPEHLCRLRQKRKTAHHNRAT